MAITFVASSRGPTTFPGSTNNIGTMACAKPTGTVDGDLMIAYCQSGGGLTHSAPGGWSTLSAYSHASANLTATIFYRFASGEGSSYTFTDDNGSTPLCVQILTYRGVDTTSPFNQHTEGETNGTDTVAAPSATSTALGTYVWFRTGKTSTVDSEGDFAITGGTARQKSSNRGGSTQYFVESADSNGDLAAGAHSGASFNSSLTLTGSVERTVVLKSAGVPASGPIAASTPKVSATFTGSRVMPDGPIDAELPSITADFVGTAAPPEGSIDATLPKLSAAFEGSGVGGPFASTLGSVTSTWAGGVESVGAFAGTLGSVTSSFVAETRPFGENVITIDEEKRAFRITQDDMIPIFRSKVTQE